MPDSSPSTLAIANKVDSEFDLVFYGGQLRYYEDGFLRPAEMVIRNYLQGLLGKYFSSKHVSEVFYTLESRHFVERIPLNVKLINFQNYILNWIENKTYEHDSIDVKFISQLPVNYNPDAKCPQIQKFLDEVVDSEDQQVLLQYLGYCMIPTTRFEKALMLIGDGANGKSTLLKLVIAMLGQENISTLSLFDLSHRFRLAEIVGKLVNIYTDLPSKKLEDSSVFKAILSGDPITGERKYAHPFTFKPYTRLLFSTNKLPTTIDISPAFFRRWLIIEFPHTFDEKKRDTGLFTKLSKPEELEGLAQLAIQGLRMLKEADEFSESTRMAQLRSDYERSNNPVAAFFEERCIIDAEAEIKKADLFKLFIKYVNEWKLPSLGRNEFIEELKRQVPSIIEVRDSDRKWRGIKLRR